MGDENLLLVGVALTERLELGGYLFIIIPIYNSWGAPILYDMLDCGDWLEQRVVEAQACLKYQTDMTIAEVAAACGFRDANYFSLVFSRKCGVSPSDFRRNWKTDTRLAQL